MPRRIVLLLISILIFSAAIYYYIDTIFLPIQLKNYVTVKSEKYLNRPVTIKSLDFSLLKGFVIKDIMVGRKDEPTKPFIEIQEVVFHLLLTPFIRKSAVIIPSITIQKPFLYLVRNDHRSWNYSDLTSLKNEPKRRQLPSILLRKMTLTKGEVYYRDQTNDFSEYITDINLNSTLSLNKGIRFIGDATSPKTKAAVKIKGNYGLFDHSVSTQVSLEHIPVAQYLPLFDVQSPFLKLNKGIITKADLGLNIQDNEVQIQGSFLSSDTDFDIGGTKKLTGTVDASNMFLTWSKNQWNGKGLIRIPSATLSATADKTILGDITADLKLFTIHQNNITGQGHIQVNNATLKLDNNVSLKGNIEAADTSLSLLNNTIHIQGDITIDEALVAVNDQTALKGSLQTQKTNFIWNAPDDQGNRKLTIDSGFTMDPTNVQFRQNRSLDGIIEAQKLSVIYDQEIVTVETQGQLKEALIKFNDEQHLKGNPHFNIFARFDPNQSSPFDYNGSLHFSKGYYSGAPYLKAIDTIEGIVTVTPDLMYTERMTFNAREIDVLLSGKLKNFDKPKLDIKFSSESIDLEKLKLIIPDVQKKIKADVSGFVNLKGSYKGNMSSPSKADIELTAQVADAKIKHANLKQDINQFQGNFEYKEDLLTWNNLTAQYNGKTYQLAGQLTNFSRPTLKTKIVSDDFDLNTEINILNQAFQFSSLVGKYLNSTFDLKGDVHLFADAEANIDLRGKFNIDLLDAPVLIPRLTHRFDQINPEGMVAGEGIFKGKLKDWRNWQLTFDASSDYVNVFDYPFTDLSIRYDQRDLNVSNCNVTSSVYDGQLSVISTIDLTAKDAPFSANIQLESLNLKRLQQDKRTKNELLAGIVNFSTQLDGYTFQWRKMTGRGSIQITDGHIWQWNILDGISGILLIPEFKSMAFHEAHADFTVGNQKIYTENVRLSGESVILDGIGTISFNKQLNFNIRPTFSEIAILQSKSRKKGPTSIITQTKDYLNIKLTGTLDKPKYHVEKFPLKIIEETIGGTTETLKGVLGNIVEEIF